MQRPCSFTIIWPQASTCVLRRKANVSLALLAVQALSNACKHEHFKCMNHCFLPELHNILKPKSRSCERNFPTQEMQRKPCNVASSRQPGNIRGKKRNRSHKLQGPSQHGKKQNRSQKLKRKQKTYPPTATGPLPF